LPPPLGHHPLGVGCWRQRLGEIVADLHCVAGWSATGLRWGGIAFSDLYDTLIEPAVRPGTTITHVVFEGLDG
jgi:DMSO/TMAO reductase YedYZ molybdopterin-dependent catalytic subunit